MAAVAARVYRQFTLPLHVRWELYPVKHETGAKAEYGGSYMEEPNWWTKQRKKSLVNELKYMGPEILLLRGLWEENRRLWRVSFPFHFGLYLLLAALGFLLIGAIAMLCGSKIASGSGSFGAAVYSLTVLTAFGGLILGAFGAAGLFLRRLSDPELKSYSSPADYFNLALFFVVFLIGLLAGLLHDPSLHGARAYLYALLTFGGQPQGHAPAASLLGSLTVAGASLIAAYIPLTHMSHMFIKYFAYHRVRWEDEPNLQGGRIEAAILKNLARKPTWAAGHIGADGRKSWGELAVSSPKEKK